MVEPFSFFLIPYFFVIQGITGVHLGDEGAGCRGRINMVIGGANQSGAEAVQVRQGR